MLTLNAPINNLGYGQTGYNIFKELNKRDEDFVLFPIGPVDDGLYSHDLEKRCDVSRFDYNATSVKIWHQNALYDHISKTKRLGFPIFELESFSNEEKASLKCCDKILVCSEWAKQVVDSHNLGVDVSVVPLGVDTNIFKPSTVCRKEKTVFFNCGKWEHRKGHDILLECFNRAFTPRSNVELWVMCDNPFLPDLSRAWEHRYKTSPLGDKIRIVPRVRSHQDVYDVMKQVDCGVFPARAEGWNLELLELMACGKQVIATNYSGHTEFCNDENSLLVNVESLETAVDNIWFHGDGLWANLDKEQIDSIVEKMQYVHKRKSEGEDIRNYKGIETAEKFTWSNTVDKLLGAV